MNYVRIVLITKLQLVHGFLRSSTASPRAPLPPSLAEVQGSYPRLEPLCQAGMDRHRRAPVERIVIRSTSRFLSLILHYHENPDRDFQSQQKLPNTSCHVSNSWARRWWIFSKVKAPWTRTLGPHVAGVWLNQWLVNCAVPKTVYLGRFGRQLQFHCHQS